MNKSGAFLSSSRGSRQRDGGFARRKGKCELCGAHGRELSILTQAGFFGWVCDECTGQLHECQVRRYCGTAEETEPGE